MEVERRCAKTFKNDFGPIPGMLLCILSCDKKINFDLHKAIAHFFSPEKQDAMLSVFGFCHILLLENLSSF